MVNYVVNPNNDIFIDNDDSKFVTAHFAPKNFYIGEFTHFGNIDRLESEEEPLDIFDYEDSLNFADSVLYNLEPSWQYEYAIDNTDLRSEDKIQPESNDKYKKTKGYLDFLKYYDKVESYNPYAKKYRNLLTKIAQLESNYRPWVVNNIGAAGYFLFINSTRRGVMKSINGPLDLNSFLNNPEIQINAAVYLARSFENSFSEKDKQIAMQKGHTIDGLISGAWLGGVGGVRRYLHKGRNASDGGTTVKARIKVGDSVSKSSKSIQLNPNKAITLMNQLPNFNIKASNPQYWTLKNPMESGHNCGKAVRLYMEALGIPTDGRPNYGGDYGPYLLNTGWEKLSPNTQPKFGDVCVIKGQGKNKEGHISMYDGQKWISDYIQSGPLVYSWAKVGVNANFYRYKG